MGEKNKKPYFYDVLAVALTRYERQEMNERCESRAALAQLNIAAFSPWL